MTAAGPAPSTAARHQARGISMPTPTGLHRFTPLLIDAARPKKGRWWTLVRRRNRRRGRPALDDRSTEPSSRAWSMTRRRPDDTTDCVPDPRRTPLGRHWAVVACRSWTKSSFSVDLNSCLKNSSIQEARCPQMRRCRWFSVSGLGWRPAPSCQPRRPATGMRASELRVIQALLAPTFRSAIVDPTKSDPADQSRLAGSRGSRLLTLQQTFFRCSTTWTKLEPGEHLHWTCWRISPMPANVMSSR